MANPLSYLHDQLEQWRQRRHLPAPPHPRIRERRRIALRRQAGHQPGLQQLPRPDHPSQAARSRHRRRPPVRRGLGRGAHHLRHHAPPHGTRGAHRRASRTWKPAWSSNRASRPTPARSRPSSRPDDHIVSDELNHASIIDGCRLSRAKIHVFPHKDVARGGKILAELDGVPGRKLLITDGVFSMDGDIGPLPGLAELAERTAPS